MFNVHIISHYYVLSRLVLTIILFGIRGFATGLFQSIGLYTPEVRSHNIVNNIATVYINRSTLLLSELLVYHLVPLSVELVE